MPISLYKATALASLHSHIDGETGEVNIAAFDAANIALADKQLACVAYYKTCKYEIDAFEAAVKDAQAQLKAKKAAHERFADYLKTHMQATGTSEIKSNDGMFSARLLIGRDRAIELDDDVVFDDAYLAPPKPREPSKTLIKAAIDAGVEVAGARIVVRDRLEIK
jgi:Siphovirus Gp157